MHALFHIRTVIIPRNWYRPEGFSPRFDTGRGMITVLIWKKSYITGNLFIIYFNIELKRIKLTSHTDTKLMDISNRVRSMMSLPLNSQLSFGKSRCPARKGLLVFPYISTVIPQTISITYIHKFGICSNWHVNNNSLWFVCKQYCEDSHNHVMCQ
jgi:hypothetical protein